MIINTDILSEQIDHLDDKLFPNINWDICSDNFLISRERVAIKYKSIINDIEDMADEFKKIFGAPSFDIKTILKSVNSVNLALQPIKKERAK